MTDTQLHLAIGLPFVAVITIRAGIREIRSGLKLLTGNVYEWMGQK